MPSYKPSQLKLRPCPLPLLSPSFKHPKATTLRCGLNLVSSLLHNGPLFPINRSHPVSALSDYIMSISDHLMPSLERNITLVNKAT